MYLIGVSWKTTPFLRGSGKGEDLGKERPERNRRSGKCGWDVLEDRRIYFQ